MEPDPKPQKTPVIGYESEFQKTTCVIHNSCCGPPKVAGLGGDHWTFVGVVIVAEALDLVEWDPLEPLSLLISPDWLLRLTLRLIDQICYQLLFVFHFFIRLYKIILNPFVKSNLCMIMQINAYI